MFVIFFFPLFRFFILNHLMRATKNKIGYRRYDKFVWKLNRYFFWCLFRNSTLSFFFCCRTYIGQRFTHFHATYDIYNHIFLRHPHFFSIVAVYVMCNHLPSIVIFVDYPNKQSINMYILKVMEFSHAVWHNHK